MLSNALNYQAEFEIGFSAFLSDQGASEKTQINYRSDVRNFFNWLDTTNKAVQKQTETAYSLHSINSDIIENYKQTLLLNETPASTVNRRLSALRMFFQYAVLQELIHENPCLTIRNISRTIPISENTLDTILENYKLAQLKKDTWNETDLDDIHTFFLWYTKQSSS